MHWILLTAGVLAAAAGLLELEMLRRLRTIGRRLDGVDLEVQTLRVRVRAMAVTAPADEPFRTGLRAEPGTPAAAGPPSDAIPTGSPTGSADAGPPSLPPMAQDL